MAEDKSNQPLTRLETAFVEFYISTWNAALAYRKAGGKGKNTDQIGSIMANRPHVKARIDARLSEMAMGANEALQRLADQAQLNPAEFFYFEYVPALDAAGKVKLDPKTIKPKLDPLTGQPLIDPKTGNPVMDLTTGEPLMVLKQAGINWEMVRERGHLIKGIEHDRRGNVILKFHDAQAALALIGKNRKLFTDVVDLNALGVTVKAYVGISPDDWDEPPHTEHETIEP